MQQFEGGATRNDDTDKYDYEAFLNPRVLRAYGEFMHGHRTQKDGTTRAGDNWQKGIPLKKYLKSLVRHVFDLWAMERGYAVTNPDTDQPATAQELCCAIMFNAMGFLKEVLDPAGENVKDAPAQPLQSGQHYRRYVDRDCAGCFMGECRCSCRICAHARKRRLSQLRGD